MQRKIRDVDCVIEVGFPKSNLMNRWPGSWCQNTIQWEESNFPWRGWRSQTSSSRPQQSRPDPWVWQRSHQKGVDETESTHIQSALYQLQDLLLPGNGGHHPHSFQTCWCWGQVFITCHLISALKPWPLVDPDGIEPSDLTAPCLWLASPMLARAAWSTNWDPITLRCCSTSLTSSAILNQVGGRPAPVGAKPGWTKSTSERIRVACCFFYQLPLFNLT